jgi:hypothetical protein
VELARSHPQITDTLKAIFTMERTDIYIQLVMEQPVILLPVILLVLAFFVVPVDKRLFLTLLILVPWLTVARSPGLGPLSAAAKLSSGGAYLLIALSALMHPGPKRQIPGVVWLFVIVACMGIVFVLTVQERMLAFILRSQWVCVTLAGVLTARTIVSYSDLKRIINALTFGCVLALAVPISSLILFPGESFLRGIGRFQPWGANSNQTGMLFALATPLFAYAGMVYRKISFRPIFTSLLMLTIGMALLTASRQTMIAIIMVMLPILLAISKRPVMMLLGIIAAAIALPFIFSLGADANMERFGTLQTGRLDIWSAYWSDVFPRRPLFGLLGTSGESYFKAVNEVGQHPHNAWFYLMYIGGAAFALPMVYLTIYSTICGYKLWRFRKLLPGDPLLYSVLVVLLVAMYIQGIFNQVVYWPTYTWSYLHVVLASIFMCIWRDIQEGRTEEALYDDEPPSDDYDIESAALENFEDFDDDHRLAS